MDFIAAPSQAQWYGVVLAVGLFASCCTKTIVKHHYFLTTIHLGLRVRSGIMTSVYKKVGYYVCICTQLYVVIY